ncbi:MAG: Glu/Leu/Phe/Val dehydrogenase dimerization domain-containing protein [Pseudonocardiales bacterium]
MGMGVFGRAAGHEQVVHCYDARTGLRAIIAIYSTALGPALGGTRFYPYATEDDALDDVLQLSKAMAYKAAVAGLDLGGGKAVIIGDPKRDKTEALLLAYGRFVDSLGGRYITACDVGTYVEDMDVIAKVCRFATGRSSANGGAGNSGVLTAYGVFQAMRAAAQHRWGEATMRGRRVGISGVGKVGAVLAGHLVQDGARVLVADVDDAAVRRTLQSHPDVTAEPVDSLPAQDLDVFSPCALGGALTAGTVDVLRAGLVCGAANNQLADARLAGVLHERGVLYVPDFVCNSGGLIQVADEISGYDERRATSRTAGIFETTLNLLAASERDGVPPAVAADRIAEARMAAAGGVA